MTPSRPSTLRQVAGIVVLVVMLEMALLAGAAILGPVLLVVEPDTAWLERLSSATTSIDWQPVGAIPSPDGSKVIRQGSGGSSTFGSIVIADAGSDAELASLTVSAPAYINEAAWLSDSMVALKIVDAGLYAWRWQQTRILSWRRGLVAAALAIPLLGVALFFGQRRGGRAPA